MMKRTALLMNSQFCQVPGAIIKSLFQEIVLTLAGVICRQLTAFLTLWVLQVLRDKSKITFGRYAEIKCNKNENLVMTKILTDVRRETKKRASTATRLVAPVM